MDLSQRALQTTEKFFFKFQICIRNFGLKPKNFETNTEALILIKLQCVIYQWICLRKLYKQLESLFSNSFLIIGWKPKNIQTSWILIELQCFIYQWIWLDKLYVYELMESFFSNFGIIFQFLFFKVANSGDGLMQARRGRHLCGTASVLVINLWCYASICFFLNELYKLLDNFFQIRFRIRLIAENCRKFKQVQSVNIDQSAMCYISMNLSRQALQM